MLDKDNNQKLDYHGDESKSSSSASKPADDICDGVELALERSQAGDCHHALCLTRDRVFANSKDEGGRIAGLRQSALKYEWIGVGVVVLVVNCVLVDAFRLARETSFVRHELE